MFVYKWLSSRHVEPCMVCLDNSSGLVELYGTVDISYYHNHVLSRYLMFYIGSVILAVITSVLWLIFYLKLEKSPTVGSVETSDYTVSVLLRYLKLFVLLLGLSSIIIEKIVIKSSIHFQKRQLAAQSLNFNLIDKTFCELFPDTVKVLCLVITSITCHQFVITLIFTHIHWQAYPLMV